MRLSETIEELKFTSNKIADCIDNNYFTSFENRQLRNTMDILENKAREHEELKNEEYIS